jgi:hypothetical protein
VARIRIAPLIEAMVAMSDDPQTATTTRGGVWRTVVATVLIVLAAVLAPLAVVSQWADDQVGDTDRYVETITPLASDPALQQAVADRVATEVVDRLDLAGLTSELSDSLSQRGLPPRVAGALGALAVPITEQVRTFVEEQTLKFVQSQAFEDAWIEANRSAHEQMVALLTGKNDGAVEVRDGAVQVNLAAVINAVKQRLEDRGLSIVSRLPDINAQFTVFQSRDITRAQTAFRLLDKVSTWLPWLAVALFVAGVAVARSRRRALVVGGLAVAFSMLALGFSLNVFREVYLARVPADRLSPDAAASLFDGVVHFIRLSLRSVLVLFLAVAAMAWVSGPGPAATAVRRGATRGAGVLRHGGQSIGLDTGRFGDAVYAYRTPVRFGVLALALVVYVMAPHPTGQFALVLLGLTLLVLLVVEVLARPPQAEAGLTRTG